MAKILVYIDAPAAEPTAAQRELLTLAARLGEPVAVLGTVADATAIAALGTHGATAVLGTGAPALGSVLIAPQAALVAAAARHVEAAAVLLPNTADGREIAARAAIKLDSGVITDVIDVAADFTATKPVLAGSFTVTARVTRGIPVLALKPNSIEVGTPIPAEVDLEELELGDTGPGAQITGSVESPATGRPDLQDASIVVAGGRGVDGDFTPWRSWQTRWELPSAPPVSLLTPAGSTIRRRSGKPARRSPRAVHLSGHFRGDPAKGGHADGQGHRRSEQRPRCAGLRDRRLRYRRGPGQGAAAGGSRNQSPEELT